MHMNREVTLHWILDENNASIARLSPEPPQQICTDTTHSLPIVFTHPNFYLEERNIDRASSQQKELGALLADMRYHDGFGERRLFESVELHNNQVTLKRASTLIEWYEIANALALQLPVKLSSVHIAFRAVPVEQVL